MSGRRLVAGRRKKTSFTGSRIFIRWRVIKLFFYFSWKLSGCHFAEVTKWKTLHVRRHDQHLWHGTATMHLIVKWNIFSLCRLFQSTCNEWQINLRQSWRTLCCYKLKKNLTMNQQDKSTLPSAKARPPRRKLKIVAIARLPNSYTRRNKTFAFSDVLRWRS